MITLFAGCSYTAGTGFTSEKEETGLWVNLLHNNNNVLNKTKLLNVAIPGRSNAGMFQDVIYHVLRNDDIKYVFVAWTSFPRYEFSVGLECYSTRAVFNLGGSHPLNHELNTITIPGSYIQQINDRFTTLIHPHEEIVNLVKYVNNLFLLCKLRKCQLFFVNALCNWDNEYFTKKSNTMPIDYTEYTKQLISIDTRADDEIFKLYEKIHNEYNKAGGIQEHLWLNLYSSLYSNIVDRNDDKLHPGLQSNYIYYQQLSKALESRLN